MMAVGERRVETAVKEGASASNATIAPAPEDDDDDEAPAFPSLPSCSPAADDAALPSAPAAPTAPSVVLCEYLATTLTWGPLASNLTLRSLLLGCFCRAERRPPLLF